MFFRRVLYYIAISEVMVYDFRLICPDKSFLLNPAFFSTGKNVNEKI